MLGGCCVCSDERGWTENPLVYCDGQGCTVAVHQGNNYFDFSYTRNNGMRFVVMFHLYFSKAGKAIINR